MQNHQFSLMSHHSSCVMCHISSHLDAGTEWVFKQLVSIPYLTLNVRWTFTVTVFFTNKVLDLHISWSLKTFSSRASCFSFLHFGIVEKFCGQADIVESLNVQLCLSCIYVVFFATGWVCDRFLLVKDSDDNFKKISPRLFFLECEQDFQRNPFSASYYSPPTSSESARVNYFSI